MMRLWERVVKNKKEKEKSINWKEFIDVLITETLVQDNKSLTEYFKNYQDKELIESGHEHSYKNLQSLKGLDLEKKRAMRTHIMDG